MNATDYMTSVEDAIDEPDVLDELAQAAGQDPDLSDVQRGQVLGRIGQYMGITARGAFDSDELVGEEDAFEPGDETPEGE